MKRGKLPESQSQRRKRLAQREGARNQMEAWTEENRALSATLWSAYRDRLASEEAYALYEATQAQWHALTPRLHPIESPYYNHREPLEFWRAYQRMRDSRATDWEVLIAFLERDPYTFGSGYRKQYILRKLKRAPLTEPQKERLRAMLLKQVSAPPRREIREYCRLARVLDEPAFRVALESAGGWAGWMLSSLRQPR